MTIYTTCQKLTSGISFLKKLSKTILFILTIAVFVYSPHTSLANPEGGVVVAGTAAIATSDTVTTITQSSHKTIINWQSFNISSHEKTHFQQPGSSSIALNRIVGGNPSQIFGHLSANGHVFLINPAGIVFGAGSRVDVAGLLATTADIRNEDFMAGKYLFKQPAYMNGSVVNAGTITAADEGIVALVAPQVENSGIITARLGKVTLASGNEYTLDLYGDQLINFSVGSERTDSKITNSGHIYADGGTVHLNANAAGNVVDKVINMSGVIEANRISQRGGKIILSGGKSGIVNVSGNVTAAGKKVGEKGGYVEITGEKVGLFASSKIDVSGIQGGGTILVGGDYQGKNPAIQNAAYSYISGNAVLNADALKEGNGGKVIVWADNATQFYGSILARGGIEGGNGGFVETSGKEYLAATGLVDASAPFGSNGIWLLDPRNVIVSDAATNCIGCYNTSGNPDTFTPTVDDAIVSVSAIENSLNNGSDVIIKTSGGGGTQAGNITVNSSIQRTSFTATPILLLHADNNIIINQPITSTGGALHIGLSAGLSNLAGSITVANTAPITTNGGNITTNVSTDPSSTGTITIGAPISTGNGNINLTAGSLGASSRLIINHDLVTSTGDINLQGRGITAATGVNIGSAVPGTTNSTGTISLDAGGGAIQLNSSTIDTRNTTANAVNISNAAGVALGNIKVGSGGAGFANSALNIDTGITGNVTQNANTTLSTSNLSINTTGNITLNNPANDFLANLGTVSLATTGSSNISIFDTSGIEFGNVSLGSGSLTIDVGNGGSGQIRQLAGTAITQASGTGAVNLISPNGSILLSNSGNNFLGAVSISGSTLNNTHNINITDTNALTLGTSNTGTANLNVVAGGTINQNGPLTIGGVSSFSVGALNSDILLGSQANNFSATPSFGGTLTNIRNVGFRNINAGAVVPSLTGLTNLNNLTLTFNNAAIALPGISINGALTAAAGGNITQTGALTVPGQATFGIVSTAGLSDILLNTQANSFAGGIDFANALANIRDVKLRNTHVIATVPSFTGLTSLNDVTLTFNNAGMVLPTISMSGALTAAAGGNITQTGHLTVTGLATLGIVSTAGLSDILLNTQANSFAGGIDFANTLANIRDVGLRNTHVNATVPSFTGLTNLNDVTLTFNNAGMTLPALTLTNGGNLTLTAGGGDIIQTGALIIPGASAINAGGNAITLTNASNNFTGAVSLSNSGANNVSIRDANALLLGTANVGQVLSLQAGGTISQSGSTTITAPTLTVLGSAGAITLNNNNNLTALGSVTRGGAFTLNDLGGLTLSGPITSGTINNAVSITTSGLLTINNNISTSGPDITLNGIGINQTAATVLNANAGVINLIGNAGAITLDNANNNFVTPVSLSNSGANNVTIRDIDALSLDTVNVGQVLSLTAGGNISQFFGTSITAPTLTIAGAGGSVILFNNNNITTLGDVIRGGRFSLNNIGDLTIGGAITGGTLTNQVDITTSGKLTINNNISTSAGNSIILSGVGIDQTAATILNAGAGFIQLTGNAGAISLDNSNNDFTGVVFLSNSGANDVSIRDANALQFGTVGVGRNLAVTTNGNLTQGVGSLTVPGTALFNSGIGAITLASASNDFTGAVSLNNSGANNVSIRDANALILGTSGIGQNLTLVAGGTISQTGALNVPGTSNITLTAAASDILLNTQANSFAGTMSFSGTLANIRDVGLRNIHASATLPNFPATMSNLHDVSLRFDNASMALPAMTLRNSGSLTAIAGGSITQAGIINVPGLATFGILSTAGLSDILLNSYANSFAGGINFSDSLVNIQDVGLRNTHASAVVPTLTGMTNLRNLTLTFNNAAMALPALALANGGSLSATANGAITQTSVLNIPGSASFNAGAGAITLDNVNNDFTGAVSLSNTGANDVEVQDINSLILGTVGIGQNLKVTSNGALSQSVGSTLTIPGTTLFNAGAGAITLTNAGNNFVGAVSLSNSGATNDAALSNTNALVLGTIGIGRNLTVTSNGALSQAGILTIPGTASFSAGAGAITLTNANNDFTGAVSLSNSGATSDALLTDTNALMLGTIGIGRNLTVTSNGALAQAAGSALTIPGTALFNAGAGAITLTNAGNNFVGAVSLSNSGATNDAALSDTNALVLGTIGIGRNLTITSSGALTQAVGSALTIPGTASFSTGAGAITLTNAGNDFTGAVSLSNSGATSDAALSDTNALVLGTIGIGRNLTITSSGALTQAAGSALTISGTASFSAGAGAITLTNAGNNFVGAVSLSNSGVTNDAALSDTNALVLGTIGIGRNLTVTSSGALTQAAGSTLTILGTASFSAGAGAITLANIGNDFMGAVSLNNTLGNNVSIRDVNGLILGTSSIGFGTLTVNAVGITQNGALTQAALAGTAAFNAGAGVITLTHANNNFTGSVSLNNSGANDVAITDMNGLDFGTSSIGSGTFTINSVGVTQTGALTQAAGAGATTFNAGAGHITLTHVSNNFTGPVSLNNSGANSVSIRDINSLILGTSSTGLGTLTVNAVGITQNGAITQTGSGAAIFNGGAGAIILTNAGNNFTGAVSINNSGANDVAITDSNALLLGNLLLGSGSLTVNAVGITQASTLTQAAGAGAATFNAGTGVLTLNQNNDFTGAVSLNNSGVNAVFITDINALQLGTSSIGSSTLNVNAVGITQNGALTQAAGAGATTINGGAGVIALDHASNNFTGPVSLANSGANDVSIRDANALQLGTVGIGRHLNVISNGALTQAVGSALTIPGTASFSAGTGAITLTNTNNNFIGAVSLSNSGANNVSIRDANALQLGTAAIGSGTFTVNAVGITQNGALTQATGAGTTTFNAGAGTLTLNQANDFTGNVLLNNSGATNDAIINDINGLQLGTTVIGRHLTATAGGILRVSGIIDPVDVNLSGDTITQDVGAYIVATGTLTTSSVNGQILNEQNQVSNFNATNTNSGHIELTNTVPLTIQAINQTGTGHTHVHNTSGDITLNGAVNGGAGKVLMKAHSGHMVLNSSSSIITTYTSGSHDPAIELVNGQGNTHLFTNNAGTSALSASNGYYWIWSYSPESIGEDRGGLTHDFIHYNILHGNTSTQSTGNAFLYAVAPTVSTSLTGVVSKTYDGTAVATLTAANYIPVTGGISGDVITLGNSTVGTYDNKNVGNNKTVTVSGLTFSAMSSDGKPVHGYQLSSGSLSSNIGEITKAPLSLTIGDVSKVYGQTYSFGSSDYSLSGLQNGELVGVTLSSAGTVSTASVNDGPYAITHSLGAGSNGFDSSNYDLSLTNPVGVLTVTKAPLSLTIGDVSKVYGQTYSFGSSDYSLSGLQNGELVGVTLSSGGAVSTASVNGGVGYAITHSLDAGSNGFDSSNYDLSLTNPVGVLTVTKAPLSLTIGDVSKVYGQTYSFGSSDYNLSGLQNGELVGVTLSSGGAVSTARVNDGPYAITHSLDAGSNGFDSSNYDLSLTNPVGVLTVTKAPLSLTINDVSKVYGQTYSFGSSDYSLSGLQNGELVGVTLSSGGAISTASVNGGVGYAISHSLDAGSNGFDMSNYDLSLTNPVGVLTVTKAPLSLTIGDVSKVYGQTYSFGSSDYNLSGLQNGELVGVTLSSAGTVSTASVNGGPYAITHSLDAGSNGFDSSNYDFSVVNPVGVLTVTKAPLSLTIGDVSKVYGQTYSFGSSDYSLSGLQNGELVGVTLSSGGTASTARVNDGPYVITHSLDTGSNGFDLSNYDLSLTNPVGILTVTKAPLSLTIDDVSKVYGQTYSFGSSDYSLSGLQNGELVGVTLSSAGTVSTASVNDGPYAITHSLDTGSNGFDMSNYDFSVVNPAGVLTVTKAPLSLTINDVSKVYGQTYSFGSSDYSLSGLQNGELVGVTLSSAGTVSTARVNDGPYAITHSLDAGSNGFDLSNYDLNLTNPVGVLTVTKAPLSLTINDVSKVYGQTYSFGSSDYNLSGLQNGELLGVTLSSGGTVSTASVNNGPYAISHSLDAGSNGFDMSNYDFNLTNPVGALTLNPAALILTANNQNKSYGQQYSFLGSEFDALGLQNGETIDHVSISSTGADSTAPVATHDILISNATGSSFDPSNYDITYVKGQLTVTSTSPVVTPPIDEPVINIPPSVQPTGKNPIIEDSPIQKPDDVLVILPPSEPVSSEPISVKESDENIPTNKVLEKISKEELDSVGKGSDLGADELAGIPGGVIAGQFAASHLGTTADTSLSTEAIAALALVVGILSLTLFAGFGLGSVALAHIGALQVKSSDMFNNFNMRRRLLLARNKALNVKLLTTITREKNKGTVKGKVLTNIYDTGTQHMLLIPKGSQLKGIYIIQQEHIIINWYQILYSDGSIETIKEIPALDEVIITDAYLKSLMLTTNLTNDQEIIAKGTLVEARVKSPVKIEDNS